MSERKDNGYSEREGVGCGARIEGPLEMGEGRRLEGKGTCHSLEDMIECSAHLMHLPDHRIGGILYGDS